MYYIQTKEMRNTGIAEPPRGEIVEADLGRQSSVPREQRYECNRVYLDRRLMMNVNVCYFDGK